MHTPTAKTVNPLTLRKGDRILVKVITNQLGNVVKMKTQVIDRIEKGCTPETVHLNGSCYDVRFSAIQKVS